MNEKTSLKDSVTDCVIYINTLHSDEMTNSIKGDKIVLVIFYTFCIPSQSPPEGGL